MTMNKEEFLAKIGVALPPPQIHPQFGTELPQVYLDRCLDIIIPAVGKKMQDSVNLDDIIEYLKDFPKAEKPVEIQKDTLKGERPVGTHEPVQPSSYLSHRGTPRDVNNDIAVKILEYYKNNPNKSIGDCSFALGITYATVGRYSKLLCENGSLENVGNAVKFVFKVPDTPVDKPVEKSAEPVTKKEEKAPVEKVKEPVAAEAKNTVPASYLQDLKQRFDKRNEKQDEPKLPSWPGFVAQRYFDSLTPDMKGRAVTEFWMLTNVSPDEYKRVVELYKNAGYTVIRQKLTKLQYEMLMKLTVDGTINNKAAMQDYYEYVR